MRQRLQHLHLPKLEPPLHDLYWQAKEHQYETRVFGCTPNAFPLEKPVWTDRGHYPSLSVPQKTLGLGASGRVCRCRRVARLASPSIFVRTIARSRRDINRKRAAMLQSSPLFHAFRVAPLILKVLRTIYCITRVGELQTAVPQV